MKASMMNDIASILSQYFSCPKKPRIGGIQDEIGDMEVALELGKARKDAGLVKWKVFVKELEAKKG